MTEPSASDSAAALREDEELLRAIAQQRDREAFARFFRRHEQAIYNLARYVTGRDDAAEDALQQTALQVWLVAKNFRGGNARAWLLSIAVRESWNLGRGRYRERRRAEREQEGEARAAGREPEEEMARGEQLVALREMLSRLDASERRMVALYYGAGMTQAEIGTELALSQAGVSYKLNEVLEKLRCKLTQAGHAAALPLATLQEVGEAVCAAWKTPWMLRDQSLGQTSLEGLEASVSRSNRVAAPKPAGPAWLLAGMAIVATAAGTIWWAAASNPIQSGPATLAPGAPPGLLSSQAAPAASRPEPYFRHWDFNTPGQANDFRVVEGSWHHVPQGGQDGSGCMETDGNGFRAALEISTESAPLLVSLHFQILLPQPPSPSGYLSKVGWAGTPFGWHAEFLNTEKKLHLDPKRDSSWMVTRTFLSRTSQDLWVNDRRLSVFLFELQESSVVHLALNGRQRLDAMSIRQILPKELPDVSLYQKALQKVPLGKRVGRVAVPELKSAYPPEPVYLQFWSPN